MKKQTQETGKIKRIHEILQAHRGKENPIKSAQIAALLGIKEDDTHSRTRGLIKKCAVEYNLPLLSSQKGYFLAKTKEELNQCLQNLNSRIAGIEERKTIITHNFERKSK